MFSQKLTNLAAKVLILSPIKLACVSVKSFLIHFAQRTWRVRCNWVPKYWHVCLKISKMACFFAFSISTLLFFSQLWCYCMGSYPYLKLQAIISDTEENSQMYKIPAMCCSICNFISFIKDTENWGHPPPEYLHICLENDIWYCLSPREYD